MYLCCYIGGGNSGFFTISMIFVFSLLTISCEKKDTAINNKANTSERFWTSDRDDVFSGYQPYFVSMDPGDTIDVAKFGEYHNLVLEYALYEMPETYLGTCMQMDTLISILNEGVISVNEDIVNFIPIYSNDCNSLLNLLDGILEPDVSNIDVFNVCQEYLDTLVVYAAIDTSEKTLINLYMDSLINGNLQDYNTFKIAWSSLPNKKYNGAFSAALFSIGIYSYEFWKNYNGGTIENPEGLVWTDFGGAIWGYASYMYDNWSHHYEEDFGKEALKAGAKFGLGSSFVGGVSRLGK